MTSDKCGVYTITCSTTGKVYVGSSVRIYARWGAHRTCLRKGKSTCIILQHAWSCHGEQNFEFKVVEECKRDDLYGREQYYVATLRPVLNSHTDVRRRYGAAVRAKINARLRARAAFITRCPRGHEYTEANTYRSAKGKRICRACNALRVSGVYAAETPEQREARRARAADYYERNKPTLKAQSL